MQKAFSLMEVLIATLLLSVVMIALFQVKSNKIFLVEKSTSSKTDKEFLTMAFDSKEYSKRNKNLYLDKYFNIKDDDLRRELQQVKIKLRDEILEEDVVKLNDFSLKIIKSKSNYSFEKGISKDIYRFQLKL